MFAHKNIAVALFFPFYPTFRFSFKMQRNPFPVKSAVMEPTTTAGTARTPVKTPRKSRSENVDPNVQVSTPVKKPISSSPSAAPSSRSAKSKKKTPNDAAPPPPPPVNRRKFLIVKKNRKKCEDVETYRQAAYEALHASHENFFKNVVLSSESTPEQQQQPLLTQTSPDKQPYLNIVEEEEGVSVSGLAGSSKVKKMRRIVLEEARKSIPAAGTGQVKHLVNAFESLLSISKTTTTGDGERNSLVDKDKRINLLPPPSEEDKKKNWPLPGIQFPTLPKTSSCCSSPKFCFPPKLSVNEFSSVFSSTDSSNASTRLVPPSTRY